MPRRGGYWPESCGFALTLMRNGWLTLGASGRSGLSRRVLTGWVHVLRVLHPKMDPKGHALFAARFGVGYRSVAAAFPRALS